MDGLLLQTVEGLGEFPLAGSPGEVWELLQAEKEGVSHEILAQGPLHHDLIDVHEIEPSEESAQQIEWLRRGNLEERLRHINDAQDRLIDGRYGVCVACGDRINEERLLADPAASMCFDCQRIAEGEMLCRTL